MPRIIAYDAVVQQMLSGGFSSLYPNSGAFDFSAGAAARTLAWIGPPDSTIRPQSRPFLRAAAAPHESNLARLTTRLWLSRLPVPVWLMPRSHWAYELDFGSRDWLPGLLQSAGVDAHKLAPLNNGSAVEFETSESEAFEPLLRGLLEKLLGSDFMLAWPGRPVLCTVHHHKQLWWTSTDDDLMRGLDELIPPAAP